jgi:hypothetical protein
MRVYVENAQIPISQIAMSSGALLCRTDRTDCCGTGLGEIRRGEWLNPDNDMVKTLQSGDDFYRNRGTSVMRLHRRNNAMQPTGLYCCVVDSIVVMNDTTCVNLSEYNNPIDISL